MEPLGMPLMAILIVASVVGGISTLFGP